jgi:hypothetical protein
MKTKFTLTLMLVWLAISNGLCQNVVCEGDITLSSQADVDAFNCTEITGSLYISGADITDLSPLQNLTKVGRLFITENTNLATVDGLSGLREITLMSGFPYAIGISGNPSLKNLDGLGSLTMDSIGPIAITYNASLETINGFSSVTAAFGLFSISNNASLKSINGFQNLTSVRNFGFEPFVMIDNNPSLISINGFSSLEEISGNGGNLQISNNNALTSINGFSSLTVIAGGGRGTGLFIENNASLTNIDGFSSLSVLAYGIAGAITIRNNVMLTNVDPLSNIKVLLGNFRLTVTHNTSLTNCAALFPIMESYGLQYVTEDNFRIFENGSGCTLQDIIANGPPTVAGFSLVNEKTGALLYNYFYDNDYFDMSSPDFPTWILRANTHALQTVGSVEFKVNNKNIQVDNAAPFLFDFNNLPPGTYTVVATAYSKKNRQGNKGAGRTFVLVNQNPAAIVSFDVVDPMGNVLMTLNEGDRINAGDPAFKSFTIRANTYPENVNNVKFYVNGRHVRTETVAPYSLSGDNNGSYFPWNPTPGNYTLRAVPYIKPAKQEYAGTALQLGFEVYNDAPLTLAGARVNPSNGDDLKVTLYPVPVKETLFVQIANGHGDYSVALKNSQGYTIHKGTYSAQQAPSYNIATSELYSGVYFLQIKGANGFEKVIRIMK